jgi:hypothetical protein
MPPRPSHPAPNVRDDREAPLLWEQDGKGYSSDLGLLKIRIFFQKGLDRGQVICPSGIGGCAAQGALQGFLLFERRSFLGWRPLVTSSRKAARRNRKKTERRPDPTPRSKSWF